MNIFNDRIIKLIMGSTSLMSTNRDSAIFGLSNRKLWEDSIIFENLVDLIEVTKEKKEYFILMYV